MATIQELRAQAKAEYKRGKGGNSRLKGYGRMNKSQLLSALNMSENKASQNAGTPDRSFTASEVPSSPTRTKLLAAVKRKVEEVREKNPDVSEEQLRGVATKVLGEELAKFKKATDEKAPTQVPDPKTHEDFMQLGNQIAGDFTARAKQIVERFNQLDASDGDPSFDYRQNRAKDKRYSELIGRKLDLGFDDDDDRSALKSGKLSQDEYDKRKQKRESELKTIEEERELLAQKLDAEFDAKTDKRETREDLEKEIKAFTDRLIVHNGLSKDDAMALVDKTKLPKNAGPELKEQMAEFYQLTGGKGANSIRKITYTKERPYAIDDKVATAKGDKEALLHEMAHHIEFEDVRIRFAAAKWVESKATGEPRTLNEITNSKLFDSDEIAYPGKYLHPYIGKKYEDFCTEVISMGMEQFTSPRRLAKFAADHPDHFAFLIGVLGSKKRA